jgi:DinB superfamily
MKPMALDTSRDRVLQTAGDGGIVLAHATAARMVAAWALDPAPRNPVHHLETAHARARSHLARLASHDPSREVLSPMTNEMYSRLTDARPAPLTKPAGVGRYTYTPRKALRRVLDHALDHLNQIDQWLAWQRNGVVPTPTDGWVSSTVTLPDDRLPLVPAALDAWLWRIDQAARLVVQRAASLTETELDWLPPDGGWPLRRVLHHLARSERLYAAALDEALPDSDPAERYEEACRRLDEGLRAAAKRGEDTSIVYAGLYGVLATREELVGLTLAIEGELLTGAR